MARIGSIYVGGKEGRDSGEVFTSGIGFFLDSDSMISDLYFSKDDWEIELSQGNQCIVARSTKRFTVEQILSIGFDLCQKFLDLVSVEGKGDMTINSPGDRHIILFYNGDKVVLRYVSTTDLGIGMSVSVTKMDKDGNVIPDPPQPPVDWIPAFRYYRLSQTSRDIYEAYRNLFLGLESLLNIICPKAKSEGERNWLLRSLNLVNKKVPLGSLVPHCNDPVAYLVGTQYDNVRCKLFHAKQKSVLPYEALNLNVMTSAYETLARLWRQIAIEYFAINRGGGVVTYQGFKYINDNVFGRGFEFCTTSDPSVPTKEDNSVSPLGYPVFTLHESEYMSEVEPGRVLLKGALISEVNKIEVIHRIFSRLENTLFSVSYIEDGLFPIGVDRFENYEFIRLVNKSTPKTIF